MIKPRCYTAKTGMLVALAYFALAFDVAAGEWTAKSGLEVKEVYSDNIELEENGEESELITVVSPSFNISGKGSRASVKALATFQFHNAGGNSDAFLPRINASADAELIEDFFFIDATLFANQSSIDPLGRSGNSATNDNDNVTTTYDYTISPYIVRHFGNTADLELRYTYDDQINKDEELSDSVKESVLGSLKSGKSFSRLSWELIGDHEETTYDGDGFMGQDAENEKTSASINLGYQLYRRLQISGTIGQEWNSFEPADGDDPDDQFWDIGAIWEPNQRTMLDFGYGKHFFSTTPRFKFTHKTRRTSFKASYSRSLTDTRSERRNTNPFGLTEEQLTDEQLEALGGDLSALNQFLTDNFTAQDQGIFVNERFDTSLSLKGKRSTATLYLKESKQIREDISDDSIFTSFGMRFERELSAKTTFNSRVSWNERENGISEKVDTARFFLSLKRKIGTRTSVSISYDRADRDSDRANDDYKENRISLSFSIDL